MPYHPQNHNPMIGKKTPKEEELFSSMRIANYSSKISCYLKAGGYDLLKKSLKGKPESIGEEVLKSGVREEVGQDSHGDEMEVLDRKSGKPIYLICNADESEPGTFKDRQIIHKDPHQLIEGMMFPLMQLGETSLYLHKGRIFEGAKILERAIAEAKEKGFVVKIFWVADTLVI